MATSAADFKALGELVRLAAETAADLAAKNADGEMSRIMDCASQLNVAANELIEISEEIWRKTPNAL